MSGEIQVPYSSGKTVYALVRDRTGQVWHTGSSVFQAYATANYSSYTISLTEQGTASGYYAGTFPSAISAGVYNIVAKNQSGGSPAETDAVIGTSTFDWSGTAALPLSDLVTSGQLSQLAPIRIGRGQMVQYFPLYMRSAFDHVTPLTSGATGISGQIARDNGSFGPLQSGAFTERGLGFYYVQALTSGDLLGNTISLLFTHTLGDPVALTILTQKTSGQV